MSRSFTIVPREPMNAMTGLLELASLDPAVRVVVEAETTLVFAGRREIVPFASTGEALASLRLLGSGVIHASTAGYEGSLLHMARYVRWLFMTQDCRAFDDESGEELDTYGPKAAEAILALP